MANPEMSSAQEQGLGAVPSQASRPDARQPDLDPAGAGAEEPGKRLPLMARVLLADLGVAIVALIALTVIEVQRLGEAGYHLRQRAYAEDLVVLFLVVAVFGVVTFLLMRAGQARVALVQAVVTAVVLGLAVTSAVAAVPKPDPVTVEQDQ